MTSFEESSQPPVLAARFAAAVRTRPERAAIEFGTRRWSYRDIDTLSDNLAARLQQQVHPDHVAVIHCERGPLLVLAMLACVKAGRLFFIVGENQPEAYVARALENVGGIAWIGAEGFSDPARAARIAGERLQACLMLGAQDLDAAAAGVPFVAAGDGPAAGLYLVATSGTTGKPKLVLTGEAPILNFLDWYGAAFALTHEDKFSMLSGLGYDPLIRDVFTALCLGACVAIPDADALGRRRGLHAWAAACGVTVIHATPQLAQLIFDQDQRDPLPAVRVMAVGGAGLGHDLAQHVAGLLDGGVLLNVYGASETPQIMTCHRVERAAPLQRAAGGNVAVGKPIAGVGIAVLDDEGVRCADGTAGEIFVVTPHLASGYYQDATLSAEKFVNLAACGGRAYRTGDLGFLDAEGALHYVGRKDRQVKVRGYRIQLEEVEQALQALPQVEAAAVVFEAAPAGGKLVCYLQAAPGADTSVPGIKQALVDVLPTYMMPDRYVVLARMPMNSRHKIDYAALKAAAPVAAKAGAAIPGGSQGVARQLLTIWSGVLDTPSANIGLDSNFFDVGGNSLLSVKLIEFINKRFSKNMKTTDLFVHSNINELSKFLAATNDEQGQSNSVANAGRRAHYLSQVGLGRNRKTRVEL